MNIIAANSSGSKESTGTQSSTRRHFVAVMELGIVGSPLTRHSRNQTPWLR
jgi:hypothetical protein